VTAGTDTVSVLAGIVIGVAGDQVDMAYAQAERVDIRANQSPSEYVATNVLSRVRRGDRHDQNFDTMAEQRAEQRCGTRRSSTSSVHGQAAALQPRPEHRSPPTAR
jgi:hypothetical protein